MIKLANFAVYYAVWQNIKLPIRQGVTNHNICLT